MPDALTILAVTNIFPTDAHPTQGLFVAEQVKGLRDIGLNVDVFYVDRAGKGMGAYLGMLKPLGAALLKTRPALLHVMYGGIMADQVTRWNSSCPTIVTFHGSDLLGENLSGRWRRWISHYGVRCSRRAARRAQGVVVVSQRLKQALPEGLDEDKVRVIPCGIDLERFQPMDKLVCRRQLGWTERSFHVLFPSNNGDPVKRPWLAASAVEVLNHRGVPAELHYMRGVSTAEVPVWMNASDALLVTSAQEGSPTVVKEALACGVSVVSVDVGDVSERINGVSGCHIALPEPNDIASKLRLVQKTDDRISGRESARPLSSRNIAFQLEGFYRETLARWNRETGLKPLLEPSVSKEGTRLVEGMKPGSVVNRDGEGIPAPLVSVVLICRCEAACIRAALNSILAQESPGGEFEIVVADGMSEDGTREILAEMSRSNPRVRVIDNPAKLTSAGLNAAIRAASGQIIVRMDAHTGYAPDYLLQCVSVLQSSGADNVGGPWVARASSYMGGAIAAAFQSRFAAGGARSHRSHYEGEVDTVYLGCWRKEVFQRFGGFDESLARNQDDEHNLRIIRGGGRIWQSPKIRSWYQSRTSLQGLFKQYLQYGYWKVLVIRKHGKPAALRHLVPGVFVLTLCLAALGSGFCALISFFWPAPTLPGAIATQILPIGLAGLAALVLPYALALLTASLYTASRTQWKLFPALPLVFGCFHFGYGLGFLRGVLDFALLKKKASASMIGLTREGAAPPAMTGK